MALTEDQILGRVVDDFLDRRPVEIVLYRMPEPTFNERGGRVRGEPVALSGQRVTLVPFKRRLTDEYRELPSDRVTKIEYIVTGSVDLDIQPNDEFDWQGERYTVEFVSALEFHRTQAVATRRMREGEDA